MAVGGLPRSQTGRLCSVGDAATFRLDGHVATITYNRPEVLNAINADMRRDLNDAVSRLRDDEDAWVAIVTGSGRAFCAGADLRQGAGSTGEFAGTFWEKPTLKSFESGWEIFKPVIAAVNGYCLGYGLTLATWCDFVLASDRAEFGLPEVRLGVPPSWPPSACRSASTGPMRWSCCSPGSASTPSGPAPWVWSGGSSLMRRCSTRHMRWRNAFSAERPWPSEP